MEIGIDYKNEDALIKNNYQGQNPKQMPIYLVVDWEDATITAETRNYQIGGTPARQWHQLVSAYQLPADVDAANLASDIKTEYLPLIEKIRSGFETKWDGNNRVGRFTEDARQEMWKLKECLANGVGLSTIYEEKYTEYLLDKEIIDEDGN
jgi:hypothetical protein